jgi:hypothetical protein
MNVSDAKRLKELKTKNCKGYASQLATFPQNCTFLEVHSDKFFLAACAVNKRSFLMNKAKSNRMTREAASRIASHESRTNQGRILPGGFASRVDAVVQRAAAKVPPAKAK